MSRHRHVRAGAFDDDDGDFYDEDEEGEEDVGYGRKADWDDEEEEASYMESKTQRSLDEFLRERNAASASSTSRTQGAREAVAQAAAPRAVASKDADSSARSEEVGQKGGASPSAADVGPDSGSGNRETSRVADQVDAAAALARQRSAERVEPLQRQGSGDQQESAAIGRREAERQRLLAEDAKENDKESISMVIVGHVDAGKSTLLGHLLVLLGDVEERVLLRYERDSRVAGKPSFHFAWILDQSEQERARGITVEVATRHIETPHRRVTVLDAPGHRDFVPNMIGGAAQADACLLVVPATRGEFETAFAPSGQTREHAILAKSLGVDQAVLVVNKMDAVQWSQERFDEVVGQVIPFLRSVGFKEKALCAVPVSAFAGENLVRRQEPLLAAWYSGPTLLEAIDAFSPPARLVARPLRFSVSAVVSATSSALTLSGRVESGSVMAGERVLLMPQRELVTVKSLLRRQDVAKVLRAGEVADIVLKGVPDGLALAPGMCICDSAHPTPLVLVFRARILTLDIKLPLLPGLYTFFSQGVSEGCVVTRLLSKFKRGTQEEERRHPRHIPRHAGALVEVELQRPLCLELNAEYRGLGRFALRRGAETVCVGVVTELVRML